MSSRGIMNGDTPSKLNFIIVGGSLGGLATGLALKSLGHDITILERNPTPLLHDQGAGIVAGGDTLDFFKRYNKCQRPIAVSSQRRQYLNEKGGIVHKEDMVQNMTSWDLAYHIMRANFDGVESKYCEVPESNPKEGKAIHLHGHKVTSLKEVENGVQVCYQTSDGRDGSMLADMVIGADGPNSTIRSFFLPDIQRTYAGYCALRGTVRELDASPATREAFSERFTFFHRKGVQILAYLIPGINGTVEPGQRLINFVYYTNFPMGTEIDDILTDDQGQRHHTTIPPGKVSPSAWSKQKQLARERLPPQFVEIVCNTQNPFVQAVTDVISPEHEFLNGKVILIGDALAGFRPHTVASTSQAAFDAMIFADYVAGKVSREEWKKQTMGFARFIQKRGVDMGNRSQHEDLALEEHIHDRNVASTPRQKEVYPKWAVKI